MKNILLLFIIMGSLTARANVNTEAGTAVMSPTNGGSCSNCDRNAFSGPLRSEPAKTFGHLLPDNELGTTGTSRPGVPQGGADGRKDQ